MKIVTGHVKGQGRNEIVKELVGKCHNIQTNINIDSISFYFMPSVFMEKGVIENQSNSYANDVLSDECSLEVPSYDLNNKKVLIASRHTRNDSKGIQLEFR